MVGKDSESSLALLCPCDHLERPQIDNNLLPMNDVQLHLEAVVCARQGEELGPVRVLPDPPDTPARTRLRYRTSKAPGVPLTEHLVVAGKKLIEYSHTIFSSVNQFSTMFKPFKCKTHLPLNRTFSLATHESTFVTPASCRLAVAPAESGPSLTSVRLSLQSSPPL